MDTESKDQDIALQQPRKKGALKKLSKVGKAIRKRLPKTPKSERTLGGSLTGPESGATTTKRQNSLTSRLKKRFSHTPRRSLSVTDLDALGATEKDEEDGFEDDHEIAPVTDSLTRTEDSIEEETKTHTPEVIEFESVSYPSTPVPEPRERQPTISISTISAESFERHTHYARSTNEYSVEIEPHRDDSPRPLQSNDGVLIEQLDEDEEPAERRVSDPLGGEHVHDYYEQGVEIIQYSAVPAPKNDAEMLDAAATIDLGIKETVADSFDQAKLAAAAAAVVNPEPQLVEEEEAVEKVEPVKETLQVTPREMDPFTEAVVRRPREVELNSEITAEPEEDESSKAVAKQRRHRFRRFLLREAPISLATLAVGLLFIVLKNRAK